MTNFESLAGSPAFAGPKPAKSLFENLEALACSTASAFEDTVEHIVEVRIGKPPQEQFFRTDIGRTLTTTLYHDKDRGEFSFVVKDMAPKLDSMRALTIATLIPYVTRSGMMGLWPVKPASESRSGWLISAAEAAKMASTQWVRMYADREKGAYRVLTPLAKLEDPTWPDLSLNQMLEMGFRDRIIDSDDHPVMNRLLGRI